MDTKLIYDPNKLSCSKPLHIGKTTEHFFKSLLDKRELYTKQEGESENENSALNEKIVACLKKNDKYVSDDHFKDVEERCNIDNLKSDTDAVILNFPTWKVRKLYTCQKPLPNVDLETLHKLHQFKMKMKQSQFNINLTMERYLKYRSNIIIEPEIHADALSTVDTTNMSLITIRTYQPFKHVIGVTNVKQNPRFDREFKVLGCTSLKDLRTAFACRQDSDSGEEKSKMPTKLTIPGDIGMGLIYINGILYIDDRYSYEESHEYARQVQEWGAKKKIDIRIFNMDKITLQDIYVRLGYPNVYQHRGCCEHLFVVSDIECLTNEVATIAYQYKYPLVTLVHGDFQSYCSICSKYVASWITLNNPRTVTAETLFCRLCFTAYNYTKNGEKIGSFDAYTYISA